MKELVYTAALSLALAHSVMAAQPTAESARTTGDIIGTTSICSLLGIDRVIGYVPGHSFAVRPAADGSFAFNFVPPGTYDVIFESPDGEIVSRLSGVIVDPKQVTDLGVISICVDVDGDGYNAIEDCDDSNINIYPGAPEVCNLIDDNCDGSIDEGFSTRMYYRDADLDGYGDPNVALSACSQPNGFVTNNADCYDGNADARPGQAYYFASPRGDGSYDYNCDNIEQKRYEGYSYCTEAGLNCDVVGTGYWSSNGTGAPPTGGPNCGLTTGAFGGCREVWGGPLGTNLTCENREFSSTQTCR